MLIGVAASVAQQTVKGTVISGDDGQPIIGAAIIVDGTTRGTITNIDGEFAINATEGEMLTISFVGMDSQTLPAVNGMQVVLNNNTELEEVVVTGMVKTDKRLFTGSATKVSAQDAKLDGVTDVGRLLEGRAAGVSVQNVSGSFGASPKIRVRGATSIFGSSKPLWVVDGIIMEDVVEVSADDLSSGDANTLISSAIAGLNAEDIESFQILKDGSATSIYGARAMAGVIVVTTKKGKSGSSRINYTGEFTMRLKPRYRNFDIMNSQDQMSVLQELEQKGYLNYAETANAATSGVYGKMYQLLSQYDETTGQFALENTPEARAAYLRQAEYRNTDWFDRLFSTEIMQSHSLSMSGGTDRSQYYTSLSVMVDPGWSYQSKVQRYTANANVNFDITSKVSFNIISNAAYRKQKAPGTLSSERNAVTGVVARDFDINPYSYSLNTSRTLDPNEYYTRSYAKFNIFHELDNNYIDIHVVDLKFQGELKVKPIQHLELSALGAVKYSTSSQEHHIKDDSNQALSYRAMSTATIRNSNSNLYTDEEDIYALPKTILPTGGIYQRTERRMTGYDARFSATYNRTFNDIHIANLYAGMEINNVDREGSWFRGWGMEYDNGEVATTNYLVLKKSPEYFSIDNTHDRAVSFFGVATYSYMGKYTVNLTGRYEGSNKLGRARSARWLPTWNVAGAWNAHEEEFFDALRPALSHFTAKLSYSLTADRGPSDVDNSLLKIGSKSYWRPIASDKETGLYIDMLANEDLTYEKKNELNFGIDAGFLNDRFTLTLDLYTRNNYDLIGPLMTQGVGGEVKKYGNVAEMKSRGVEVSLSTVNIKLSDFAWTTSVVYSHMWNEVSKLNTRMTVNNLTAGTGYALEGYPVKSIFSIPFLGLNNEGLPTFRNQDGEVTVSDINFQESDPEKLGFLKYEGSADPTDVGSLGNTLKWKGLTLNVFFTYSLGNVLRLDPVFSNAYTDMTASPNIFKNRWEVAGDEKHTNVPVIASKRQNKNDTYLSTAYSAYNYSNVRIAKGDFVRLKEVSLNYDFPTELIEKAKLKTLSVKLLASNIALVYSDSKLHGQDPEFFNTGGVATPMPKQFTLSLRAGF